MVHFRSLIPSVHIHSCHLLFDHFFQFALIPGPNIPSSYAILFFTASDFTSITSHVTSAIGRCFCFGSISSFFLELFLHSSPVAYLAPTNLGSSSFSVISFAFSYCSLGSHYVSILYIVYICQFQPPSSPYPPALLHPGINLCILYVFVSISALVGLLFSLISVLSIT